MFQYLVLICLFMSSICFAVDPVVNMNVSPQSIGTNEVAEIRIDVINTDLSEIPIPSTNSDQFTISYRGTSYQKHIQSINGKTEFKNIASYIYQFTPHTSGKITIPTFVIKTKQGKSSYSPSSTITVEKTDYLKSSNPQANNVNPFNMFFDEPTEIFLELRPKKTTLTQNTSLLIDLYIFSDHPKFIKNSDSIRQHYAPRFDGGIFYSIPLENNEPIITEQYSYSTLYGKRIAQYLAFPIEKGEVTFIPPVYVAGGRLQNYTVIGDPIKINSIPMSDSITYIGNDLQISNTLQQTVLKENQEYKFDIILDGDGNVDFFVNPFQQLSISNLFISSPKSLLEVGFEDQSNSNNIYVKKTFSYTIIPNKKGSYTIPAINLNFITSQGKKTNINTKPINLEVIASSEIIKNADFTLQKLEITQKNFTYSSGLMYIIGSIILGILIILWSFLKSEDNKRLSTDPAYARFSKAKKRLYSIMKEGEQAIKDQKYKDAARLIRQSIIYYCTDKFNLEISSSPQEIIEFLECNNYLFENKEIFLETMNTLDFYAFAQTPSEIQIKEYLSTAYKILDTISSIKI